MGFVEQQHGWHSATFCWPRITPENFCQANVWATPGMLFQMTQKAAEMMDFWLVETRWDMMKHVENLNISNTLRTESSMHWKIWWHFEDDHCWKQLHMKSKKITTSLNKKHFEMTFPFCIPDLNKKWGKQSRTNKKFPRLLKIFESPWNIWTFEKKQKTYSKSFT